MKNPVENNILARFGDNEHMTRFLLRNEARLANKDSALYKSFWNGRKPVSIAKISEMFEQMLSNNEIRHYETAGMQVVFDLHAMQRTDERAWYTDIETFVKAQLQGDVLEEVLVNDVIWDEETNTVVPANPDSEITATAVVKEGDDLIPIYEAGALCINIRTMLEKRIDWFLPGTRVLFVDKNGKILEECIIKEKGSANVSPEVKEIVLH